MAKCLNYRYTIEKFSLISNNGKRLDWDIPKQIEIREKNYEKEI